MEAVRKGDLQLPLIEVDFSANKKLRSPLPTLTTLEVPHLLADAILRDSAEGAPEIQMVWRADLEGLIQSNGQTW